MPVTHLHFGLNASAAWFLPRQAMIGAVLANVVIDIQPALVLFFGVDTPLHGLTHTFLGAALLTSIAAGLHFGLLRLLRRDDKLLPLAAGWLFGGFLHVLLDALMHSDMAPLYPLSDQRWATEFTRGLVTPIWQSGYVALGILVVISLLRRSKRDKS